MTTRNDVYLNQGGAKLAKLFTVQEGVVMKPGRRLREAIRTLTRNFTIVLWMTRRTMQATGLEDT